jgi:hypothetical protein
MIPQVASPCADSASLLTRRWNEARLRFDQTRVDFRRLDSLAKLTARIHRESCQHGLARAPFAGRQAA